VYNPKALFYWIHEAAAASSMAIREIINELYLVFKEKTQLCGHCFDIYMSSDLSTRLGRNINGGLSYSRSMSPVMH
jgi:hypothetical protein